MERVAGYLSGLNGTSDARHNVIVNKTMVVIVSNFVEENEIVHFVL